MRAMLAMLRDPARDWALEDLAAAMVTSLAMLVRAFRAAAVTPLAFLADLRLGLARQRLQRSEEPNGQIAAEVGYQSETTFSRAMLRRYGICAGALRSADESVAGRSGKCGRPRPDKG